MPGGGEQLTRGIAIVGGIAFKPGGGILTGLGAPVNGAAGTGAGVAGPGYLYIDATNSAVYLNTNTKASPTWSNIGTVAGLTATGAELNVLHTVTAGAAKASSGVVLDANLQVSGIRIPVLTKTASYPIVVGDSEATIITNPTATDITLTLPAAAAGLTYRVINKGTSNSVGLSVVPAGTEKVFAKGITAGAGKGVINTHATEAIGDGLSIWSDGTDWYANLVGTWARVA